MLELTRTEIERAEAAGYTFLDDPEREVLADVLHRVLELVAVRRFEGGPGTPDLPLEKVHMIVELRERIRLPARDPRRGRLEPPEGFWRDVPCGHPPDPIAAALEDGYACHCGWLLNDATPLPHQPPDAPGPIVPCAKCGCHVAIPVHEPRASSKRPVHGGYPDQP